MLPVRRVLLFWIRVWRAIDESLEPWGCFRFDSRFGVCRDSISEQARIFFRFIFFEHLVRFLVWYHQFRVKILDSLRVPHDDSVIFSAGLKFFRTSFFSRRAIFKGTSRSQISELEDETFPIGADFLWLQRVVSEGGTFICSRCSF